MSHQYQQHQPPPPHLALGPPYGMPFPGPLGGKDMGMMGMPPMPGFGLPPPAPASPGKGGRGRKGKKLAAGEENDEEEEDGSEGYEDGEDDEEDEDANNQQGGPNGSRRRRKRLTHKWSAEEDMILANLVQIHGQRDWGLIARHMPGRIRKGKQCRERWRNQVSGSQWMSVSQLKDAAWRTSRWVGWDDWLTDRLLAWPIDSRTNLKPNSWTRPSSATSGRPRRRTSCRRPTPRSATSASLPLSVVCFVFSPQAN